MTGNLQRQNKVQQRFKSVHARSLNGSWSQKDLNSGRVLVRVGDSNLLLRLVMISLMKDVGSVGVACVNKTLV
jgi:hypothetical protein